MKHKLHLSLFLDILISVFIALNISTQCTKPITSMITIPVFQIALLIHKQFLCLEIVKVFYTPKTRTNKKDIYGVFMPVFIYQYLIGLFTFSTMKKVLDGDIGHISHVWGILVLISLIITLITRDRVLSKLLEVISKQEKARRFCSCGKEHP